ncbi:MAG: hypothetical protein NC084_07715 [Bacteroides sp.]|nr:hypothetical protein [Bacteroides sp.]
MTASEPGARKEAVSGRPKCAAGKRRLSAQGFGTDAEALGGQQGKDAEAQSGRQPAPSQKIKNKN